MGGLLAVRSFKTPEDEEYCSYFCLFEKAMALFIWAGRLSQRLLDVLISIYSLRDHSHINRSEIYDMYTYNLQASKVHALSF